MSGPRSESLWEPRGEVGAEQEAQLQYERFLNANARRRLYKYAVPPRNIWLEIADNANLRGDETILDVGTGTGILLDILGNRNGHHGLMLGIDKYPEQLPSWQSIARKNPHRLIDFQYGDAQNIQFEENTFDAAFELFLFYHLPDPGKAALELRKVTKPGARIIVSSRDPDNMEGLWNFAHLAAADIGAIQHDSFYDRCDIERTGQILGEVFEIEKFVEQDSPIHVPGTRHGWKNYRKAFMSLIDSMLDVDTGAPIDPSKYLQFEDYADRIIKPIFDSHVEQRGYVLDRVHQAFYVCRNPKPLVRETELPLAS